MFKLAGKKILILGGANQHLKIVEAAKEMGVYTIVTDYLQDSPCKKICDEALLLNITDVEGISNYCKRNNVSGIVSGFLDPCQMPYSRICSELGLPSIGTYEQFFQLANKHALKDLCKRNGVGTIPEYTEEDVIADKVDYPVYVKPVDSRGSRGQTFCKSKETIFDAIAFAKKESSTGDVLIEKYMGDCDEVQVTCFVANGEVFLERTVDSYRGTNENNLNKVVSCSISPSKYTDLYLANAHESVCRMIKDLGITNGPFMIQGFHKDGHFYFFDSGLRFPGVEYERVYKAVYGIDFAKLLVYFSLTGEFPHDIKIPNDGVWLDGKIAAVLFPVVREGEIHKVSGIEEYKEDKRVISVSTRYSEGDVQVWTGDVNQRFAEIDVLANDVVEISEIINKFYNTVSVKDTSNSEMLFDQFDTNRLNGFYDKP